MLTESTDQVTRALRLLLEQFKGQPNIEGVLSSWITETQALEAVLFELMNERTLTAAVGTQLDVFGRIVGEERQGREDDIYRIAINARIKLNLSSGTGDQILELFALIGAGTGLQVRTKQPRAVELYVFSVVPGLEVTYNSLLQLAKAAGVRATLVYSEDTPENTFTLDAGPGLDQGVLAGALG